MQMEADACEVDTYTGASSSTSKLQELLEIRVRELDTYDMRDLKIAQRLNMDEVKSLQEFGYSAKTIAEGLIIDLNSKTKLNTIQDGLREDNRLPTSASKQSTTETTTTNIYTEDHPKIASAMSSNHPIEQSTILPNSDPANTFLPIQHFLPHSAPPPPRPPPIPKAPPLYLMLQHIREQHSS